MEYNLADIFECVSDRVPDRPAVVVGDRSVSYAEVDQRATQLAHGLAARGIRPGDHVGLGLYNGFEYVEGMLACFKLRAIPININYRYLEAELRYLLQDSQCRIVIHDADMASRLAAVVDDLPSVIGLIPTGPEYEELVSSGSTQRDFGPRSPDDLYILYTGGTTGMPKGVMWRQEDVFFAAMSGTRHGDARLDAPEDVGRKLPSEPPSVLAAPPLMHGSAQWAAFSMFGMGGKLVMSDRRAFDAEEIWRLIGKERVGLLLIIGDAFARPLLDSLRAAPAVPDLSSLRIIMSGGALLSPSSKSDFAQLLHGARVVDTYGSSEGGTQGILSSTVDPEGRPRFKVSTDTAVLDADGRPLLPGAVQVGRLARRGRIPLGYFEDEAKTKATFPTYDGVRWSVPGDMAMLEADGTVVLLGRGSVCINTGGEKVFPEEVESVIKGAPGVRDVVVVGVPDAKWGESIVAVVQPEEQGRFDERTILEHARSHLSSYKVPRWLVISPKIVRSPAGKADYRWARDLAQASQP